MHDQSACGVQRVKTRLPASGPALPVNQLSSLGHLGLSFTTCKTEVRITVVWGVLSSFQVPDLFFFFFFVISLLGYNCFTMLC